MWAAAGRPDGNLGMEEVSVQPGQRRVFVTDWRYEKQRNDGTNYYGSHGRKLKNSGSTDVFVRLTSYPSSSLRGYLTKTQTRGELKLTPGSTVDIKADIIEVSCL
jgi:hypothetical protein